MEEKNENVMYCSHCGAVIGDDELTSGEVKVKNMADGTETPVKLDGLVEYFS